MREFGGWRIVAYSALALGIYFVVLSLGDWFNKVAWEQFGVGTVWWDPIKDALKSHMAWQPALYIWTHVFGDISAVLAVWVFLIVALLLRGNTLVPVLLILLAHVGGLYVCGIDAGDVFPLLIVTLVPAGLISAFQLLRLKRAITKEEAATN